MTNSGLWHLWALGARGVFIQTWQGWRWYWENVDLEMSYNLSTKLRAKETAVNVFNVSKDASPHL